MKIFDEDYIRKISEYTQDAYIVAEQDYLCNVTAEDIISQLLDQLSSYKAPLVEKAEELGEMLKIEIKKYLLTYDKTELMITLMSLKAFFRSNISFSGEPQMDYDLSNRHSDILMLIHIIIAAEETEFKNRSLIDGSKNLALSFALVQFYSVLINSIEHYSVLDDNLKHSKTLEDFLRGGSMYSDEYNKYMDELLFIGDLENPDDSIIQNSGVKQLMISNGVSKNIIEEKLSAEIEKAFGFNLSNLNDFICWGLRQHPSEFLIIKDKKDYFNLIETELNGSYEIFQKIIDTFSFNRLSKDNLKLNDIRNIELRSIYEVGDALIFYPYDFIFNASCFEKFMLRNHFVQYYSEVLDNDKQGSLAIQLSKLEEKSSTYLAYVILDALHSNNYKLPLRNSCPYPEVKSIVINKQTNILKGQGDIDILALNEEDKVIYNIELKYYKILHNLKEMKSKTKIEERKKNMINPKKRELTLKNNLKEVINFLGGNPEDSDQYIVRTVFLTPRPDYWLLTGQIPDVEYYTWVEFYNKIIHSALAKGLNI